MIRFAIKIHLIQTLYSESHREENGRGNPEGSEIEQKVVLFINNDTTYKHIKEVFSSQVLLG